MLVQAAKARQSKAWFRRPEDQRAEEKLATLIRLGPIVRNDRTTHPNNESPTSMVVLDPPALTAIGAHRELWVAHLPQIEVLAHQSANCLDRFLHTSFRAKSPCTLRGS
jgi:hypothetical protein